MNNYNHTSGAQISKILKSISWQTENFAKNGPQLDDLIAAMPDGAVTDVYAYETWISIYVKGDKHVLADCVRVLRTRGYKTDAPPPGDKDPTWDARFVHGELTSVVPVDLQFGSTICTRKQIGTRKVTREVEEPIYEVHCDEPPPREGVAAVEPPEEMPGAP